MKKVYDIVMFHNELDLLEIRLNTLKDVVNEFVIVEIDKTHSGQKKSHFNLNKHWSHFECYPLRYTMLKVPDQVKAGWPLENWHRRQLQQEVFNISDDDVVMFSDVDEIPNPEYVGELGRFVQDMYYFYLNTKAPYKWNAGTFAITGWLAKGQNIQLIRDAGHRGICPLPKIRNGGWHFSSVGTLSNILTKMTDFAHTEFSDVEVCNNRRELKDIHGDDELEVVPIDSAYPSYLQQTWSTKWRHLVHE